jgi:hypothetical protein
MSSKIFKIRQALLIPFAINTGLLLILLCLSIFFKGSPIERIVLTVIFIPTLILFLEAANRTATMGEQGIILRKFLRKQDLRWENITHVGCLIIRKRVYLLLTTTKGFHILSNAYDDFSALVRSIVDHVGIDKSEEEVRHQIENPLKNSSDLVSMWFAVIVIAGIIIMKILPV